MKSDPTRPSSPPWQALLVVCKDCQKRGSGPKRLKAKDVVREARTASKIERPRPRVVMSGCLGLCPKRAIAVARVDGVDGARIIAAAAAADVANFASQTVASTRRPVDLPPAVPALSPLADRAPDSAGRSLLR